MSNVEKKRFRSRKLNQLEKYEDKILDRIDRSVEPHHIEKGNTDVFRNQKVDTSLSKEQIKGMIQGEVNKDPRYKIATSEDLEGADRADRAERADRADRENRLPEIGLENEERKVVLVSNKEAMRRTIKSKERNRTSFKFDYQRRDAGYRSEIPQGRGKYIDKRDRRLLIRLKKNQAGMYDDFLNEDDL